MQEEHGPFGDQGTTSGIGSPRRSSMADHQPFEGASLLSSSGADNSSSPRCSTRTTPQESRTSAKRTRACSLVLSTAGLRLHRGRQRRRYFPAPLCHQAAAVGVHACPCPRHGRDLHTQAVTVLGTRRRSKTRHCAASERHDWSSWRRPVRAPCRAASASGHHYTACSGGQHPASPRPHQPSPRGHTQAPYCCCLQASIH